MSHPRPGSGDVVRRTAELRPRVADVGAGNPLSTREIEFGAARPWSDWDQMPSAVLVELEYLGIDSIAAFSVGAMVPKVRKRGDQYLERANAWYADTESLVLIDAERKLERRTDGKFRVNGSWRLSVRRQDFVGHVRERAGTVPVDPDTNATSNSGGSPLTWTNVIDVLPAPVRKQVLATVPEPTVELDTLMQGRVRGVPADQEASLLRATSRQMITLHASRKITVKRSMPHDEAEARLSVADWSVRTLTAQLGPAHVIELPSEAHRELDVPESAYTALPSNQNSAGRD